MTAQRALGRLCVLDSLVWVTGGAIGAREQTVCCVSASVLCSLPPCHAATLPHCHTATLPHCLTASLPNYPAISCTGLLIVFYLASPKIAYNFMRRVEHHASDTYCAFLNVSVSSAVFISSAVFMQSFNSFKIVSSNGFPSSACQTKSLNVSGSVCSLFRGMYLQTNLTSTWSYECLQRCISPKCEFV